jgi:hypothetical protein
MTMPCRAAIRSSSAMANEDLVRQQGVGQIDRLDVLRQLFEQHPAEHRLAATDLAADLDDALHRG